MIKSFFDINNIEYKENLSLKNYNTYKLDVTCNYLVFPKTETEFINILKELKKNNIKYLILGNGSNVIFEMDHYDGVVIRLDKLCSVEYNDNLVTVGAGYSLIKLAIETINKGLSGLEFAAGIPGHVGASTAMNAGAYNSDMASVVVTVRVLNPNLEIVELTNQDMAYEYRDSFLKKHRDYYVLSTTFKLSYGDVEQMQHLIEERRKKLIEKLNLKGYSIGGAQVSEKHANFIINTGEATGKEIVELIHKIQKEIKENYDVSLKLEQIIIE